MAGAHYPIGSHLQGAAASIPEAAPYERLPYTTLPYRPQTAPGSTPRPMQASAAPGPMPNGMASEDDLPYYTAPFSKGGNVPWLATSISDSNSDPGSTARSVDSYASADTIEIAADTIDMPYFEDGLLQDDQLLQEFFGNGPLSSPEAMAISPRAVPEDTASFRTTAAPPQMLQRGAALTDPYECLGRAYAGFERSSAGSEHPPRFGWQ